MVEAEAVAESGTVMYHASGQDEQPAACSASTERPLSRFFRSLVSQGSSTLRTDGYSLDTPLVTTINAGVAGVAHSASGTPLRFPAFRADNDAGFLVADVAQTMSSMRSDLTAFGADNQLAHAAVGCSSAISKLLCCWAVTLVEKVVDRPPR